MSIFENARNAWAVLRGLKQATVPDKTNANTRRVGSDPSLGDEDVLSAAFSYYRHYTHLEPDRVSIYSDMDELYQYVLAHSALEAYIEDATQPDLSSGLSVWPQSDSAEVQAEILRLFENLEIENRIDGDLWGMGKYGDHFPLLRYEAGKGIHDAIPIDPRIVERVENRSRVLQGFSIGDTSTETIGGYTGKVTRFKPWDMVHFRIFGKRPTDKYGTPFFIQVRLIYKVLKLMEEQMTIYRMNLHPDRLVYKVFTGSAGPDERRRIVRQWRREVTKTASFDHDTGRFTSEYAPWCLTGDTRIALLDGTNPTIKELSDGKKGPEYWVYSVDTGTGRLMPGRAHSASIVSKNAEIMKITLDNGEVVRCTPEHRFLLRNGKYSLCKDLKKGDSLMPLYRSTRKVERGNYISEREYVYEPWSESRVPTHRLVAKNVFGYIGAGFVVHHKNEDKKNNDPRNLDVMRWDDHSRNHVRQLWSGPMAEKQRKKHVEASRKLWENEEYAEEVLSHIRSGKIGFSKAWDNPEFARAVSERAKISNSRRYNTPDGKDTAISNLEKGRETIWSDPEFRKRHSERTSIINFKRGRKYRNAPEDKREELVLQFLENRKKNHKVVKVEYLDGREDVYCLTVDKYHNFALTAGVITENSVDHNIFWPVGQHDQVSGVEKFAGSSNASDIFDVEYMRDLFFAGTRVPKGFMGFEDSQGYRGTDTLSAQSIKFARGVRRLQRYFLAGLTRLCKIHLALRGKDPGIPENQFTLEMTPVSYLDEAHKAELYAKRFEAVNYMLDIGSKMAEGFGGSFDTNTWAVYVLKEFGQFDDSMISKLLSPVSTGSADQTFTPAGTAFRFENESQVKKLREEILKNDDLRKIVLSQLPSAELDFQTKWKSSQDKFDISEGFDPKFDSSAFDDALNAHDNKVYRIGEENRKRLQEELKDIIKSMRSRDG